VVGLQEQIKAIATRLKELREISGLSVEQLATQLNVDVATYESYESGTVDIPVSFLYAAANDLGVELTALLTGEDPKLHDFALVRKDKGVFVKRRKNYNYQNLAYNFVQKQMETFLVTIEPSNIDKPLDFNSHQGQEFDYMLSGSMRLVINGKELVLSAGDSIYYNSELPHAMEALNGEKAVFLAIIVDAPAG
jgi:transcriptional regulator with XRE-family HTH domain